MQTSKPSPKELLKKRLAKLIKVPHSAWSRKADEKEYVEPVMRSWKKKKTCKPLNSNLHDEQSYLPYNLPKHMRLFVTQQIKRKVAPDLSAGKPVHTICDVDEQFFTFIDGRPLRQFCDLKVYMKNIREITLFRANAAYMNDEAIKIDTAYQYEKDEYNEINDLFTKSKDNFVRFAKESYAIAKEKQSLASNKAVELARVMEELEGHSFEFVRLRNTVSNLIAMYEPLSRYKKFLNTMSPEWWQLRYADSCALGSRLCTRFATDLMTPSTTSVRDYKQSAMQLQQLPPTIYFKRPSELVFEFDTYRSNCINCLQRESAAKRTIRSVVKHRDGLKELIHTEYEAVQAYVDRYREFVAYEEQCALDYNAVFDKLMMRQFERLFASYDGIKLFTCVQYVHTRIYGTAEDPRDKLSTLMRNIERAYIEVTKGLDVLNQEIVKEAANKMFSDDIKNMNRAHKAKRLLKECDILSKGLYTSFEPPRRRTNVKRILST